MAYQNKWTALGDDTRRAVFERLRAGPRAVGEIARELPVSRPAVSQHLRVLKAAGLVHERRQGTRRLYSVDIGGLSQLRADMDALWQDALDAFADVAEDTGERERDDDGRR